MEKAPTMTKQPDVDPTVDVKLERQRKYHKGWVAIRHYANQPARPLWLLRRRPNFMSTYRGVNARSA